jgi:uncharacterized membrane protein
MKYLFAFLTALSWGFSPNFAKLGSTLGAPTVLGTLLAYSVAIPTYYVVLCALGVPRIVTEMTLRLRFYIVASGISSALGSYFYWKGLSTGDVTIMVPLNSTYPLVTLFLVWIFVREESLNLNVVIGTIITIGGVILVVS